MQLICVTMGAPDNATNYTDSIALFNYVFNNYSNTTLLSDYEFDAEAATTAQNFLNDYYGCEISEPCICPLTITSHLYLRTMPTEPSCK